MVKKILVLFMIISVTSLYNIYSEDQIPDLDGSKIPPIIKKGTYVTTKRLENGVYNYLFTNSKYDLKSLEKLETKALKNLNKLVFAKTSPDDIQKLLGLPDKIIVAKQNNSYYLNYFYGEVQLFFGNSWKTLNEIRFEKHSDKSTKYLYMNKLGIDTGLDDVISFLGKPKMIVDGEKNNFENNVLYKNIEGKDGYCYISYPEKGIRIFFYDNKVSTLYLYESPYKDDIPDLSETKKPSIINNGEYDLKKSKSGDQIRYEFINTKYSKDELDQLEMKVLQNLDNIICGKATPEELIKSFGQPDKIIVLNENNNYFLTYYYGELQLFFGTNKILIEKRFEKPSSEPSKYFYKGKISLDSTLEDVISFMGNPVRTVNGEKNNWENNVLYKNIDGREGFCYISYPDKGIRFFFIDNKVNALYLFSPNK